MPRRRTLSLTDPQREELLFHRDHDAKPYVRERCAALLQIADGRAPHAVAHKGLLQPRDPDAVYAWLNHYQREGLDGILGHTHGGNRHHRPFRRRRGYRRTPPPGTASS